MIYTLTVNPAVDYHMDLGELPLKPGEINRSGKESMFPGGKGLNVSVVLGRLGIPSLALGFTAGRVGTLLEELAKENGCSCDFISAGEGETRINVKLDGLQETAVNGKGPVIGKEQEEELIRRIGCLTGEDTLVISGNLQTETGDLYRALCETCSGRNIKIVVDSEGEALRRTFPYHPFLIKPNREELISLFMEKENKDLRESSDDLTALMRRCRKEGARNVLLSLGADGAVLLTEDGRLYRACIREKRKAVSTVGAGDSMIAGFLAGLEKRSDDFAGALRLACAAGSAAAYTKWLPELAEIREVYPKIDVEQPAGDESERKSEMG